MQTPEKLEERRKFLRNLEQVKDIPTLPSILTALNEMLASEETSIRNLGDVIESDQAIAAKLLRLVNSAFYGFRAKISSIPHALVILGFNCIRNAVISISVFDAFHGKGQNGSKGKELWRHSVSTAIVAKLLAEKTRKAIPDDSFAAGLLHDIGKVILAQNFKEYFESAWAAAQNKGISFYEAEKETVPMNHCQIGVLFAKKWQFPSPLADVIEHHHSPAARSEELELVQILQVADAIVKCGEDLSRMPDFFPCPKIEIPGFLNLEMLHHWLPLVQGEIEAACEFFLVED